MSFKQRLKSGFNMTRFEFSWKMIPESWSRDRNREQRAFPMGTGSARNGTFKAFPSYTHQ